MLGEYGTLATSASPAEVMALIVRAITSKQKVNDDIKGYALSALAKICAQVWDVEGMFEETVPHTHQCPHWCPHQCPHQCPHCLLKPV